MRLGGPLVVQFDTPEAWGTVVKELGYFAALCPVAPTANSVTGLSMFFAWRGGEAE